MSVHGRWWVVPAAGCAGALAIAALAVGSGGAERDGGATLASGAATADVETTVRGCGSRGEPSAQPRRGDLVVGPTLSGLGSFARSDPSLFASRADQVGFKRFIERGRGRRDRRRTRWLRLAPSYHSQLKTPISVRAGRRVTLAIAEPDRGHASFMFDLEGQQGGQQVGPYWSYRISDGMPRVRLEACAADEPRFSGPGSVGPYTSFPGAMIVAGARCIGLEVHERGRPLRRAELRFGLARCR